MGGAGRSDENGSDAGATTLRGGDEGSAPTLDSGDTPSVDASTVAGRGAEVHPGDRLGGRYVIEQLLGRGGMGVVFRALDETLGKRVALKFVHPSLEGGVDRLRDEVLLAQKVTHRNVCRTYDLEEIDGRLIVKMELVEGETLAARLAREGRMPSDAVLTIARAVCEGLAAAHAEGVVHRDLKPHNVLLESSTGRVVLMDFGLARAVARPGDADEGFSGTPEYMAPEQVVGRAVDGRADLYALGCMLYELLLGKVPFRAATPLETARLHVDAPAPDPRLGRPELPSWLGRAVRHLLEKDPARRPADARAVLAELAGPAPRRRAFLGAAPTTLVAATVIALAAVGGFALLRARTHAPEWRPQTRPLPAYEENAEQPSFSPDGQSIAYVATRLGGSRAFVESLATGKARAITPPELGALEVRWARDGQHLYVIDGAHTLWRIPSDGSDGKDRVAEMVKGVDDCGARGLVFVRSGTPHCAFCERVTLRSPTGEERDLAYAPVDKHPQWLRCDHAGKQVIADLQDELWLTPFDGGPYRVVAREPRSATPMFPSFTLDDRNLLYSRRSPDGLTHVWELSLASGASRQLTFGDAPELAPVASPDGKWLLYDIDTTSTALVELGRGQRRRITVRLDFWAQPTLSPDGKQLYAVLEEGPEQVIHAVDIASGESRRIAPGWNPVVTHDGRELVFQRREGERRAIWAVPTSGGAERRVAIVDGNMPRLFLGWDDQVHVTLMKDGKVAAMRVPLAGGAATIDAPMPFTLVDELPGGWHLAFEKGFGRLVAPGRPLDDATALRIPSRKVDVSSDGRFVTWWDGQRVHRYTVGQPDDVVIADALVPAAETMPLAPDGVTLYLALPVGQVRRQLAIDFGERPPLK